MTTLDKEMTQLVVAARSNADVTVETPSPTMAMLRIWAALHEDGNDPKVLTLTTRSGATIRVVRTLVAADYGAPTTRKRLFMIARRDGGALAWPDPTHGRGRSSAWRPASEIIDWTLPCPSIFDRTRPLAEATLRRIAAGIRRYVVGAADPFIVKYHGGRDWRGHRCDEPLHTVDTANRFGLVQPFMMPATHGRRGDGRVDLRVHSIDEPVRTITGAHRGEFQLIAPFLVRHGHYSTRTGAGLRLGCGAGTFRGQPLGAPLATVCATNDKHLVVPLVTKHYKRQVGQDVRRPLGTVTARDHHSLTAAFLTKFYGTSTGASCADPLPTVTAGGGRGGGHLAEVRAFLLKYYGAEGRESAQTLLEPLHTVTTRARFGLVTIAGEDYAIADIGMRMLQPHELFAAQGFPDEYDISPQHNGRPLTKTAQIALAGNSVCPPAARALVAQAGVA